MKNAKICNKKENTLVWHKSAFCEPMSLSTAPYPSRPSDFAIIDSRFISKDKLQSSIWIMFKYNQALASTKITSVLGSKSAKIGHAT